MTPQRAKEIGIIITVLLYSLLTFALTSLFVTQGRLGNTTVVVVLVFIHVVWAAAVAVALAVVQHPESVGILVVGIASTIAIAGRGSMAALVAAALVMVALGWSRLAIWREISNRLLYRPSETFLPGLRLILLGGGFAFIGLTWSNFATPDFSERIRISHDAVSAIVTKVVPALPPHLSLLIDARQLTELTASTLNQMIQSLISTNRSIFFLAVALLAIFSWRALVPCLAWVVLPFVVVLIYLARKAKLIYLSRSQATVERLQM